MNNKLALLYSWVIKILPAIILLQTLFFKFTGSAESIYIFSKIGLEPWGRIGIGVMELITAILLIIPKTSIFGAVLGIGLMSGAIFFHLTKLGLVVQNDKGQLFIYAVIVFVSCVLILIKNRETILKFLV